MLVHDPEMLKGKDIGLTTVHLVDLLEPVEPQYTQQQLPVAWDPRLVRCADLALRIGP